LTVWRARWYLMTDPDSDGNLATRSRDHCHLRNGQRRFAVWHSLSAMAVHFLVGASLQQARHKKKPQGGRSFGSRKAIPAPGSSKVGKSAPHVVRALRTSEKFRAFPSGPATILDGVAVVAVFGQANCADLIRETMDWSAVATTTWSANDRKSTRG
jgi:hypothetical protein